MKAILALEDGTVFEGKSFGSSNACQGEVVFNTSMTGYQEILTDPSYNGQIVCMTYPEIGNYGISPEDIESAKVQVGGFIVKNLCEFPSNFRGENKTLSAYLAENNIPAIQGIDTRKLVRILRDAGAMCGVILQGQDTSADDAIKAAQAVPSIVGADLAAEVTTAENFTWDERAHELQPLGTKSTEVFKVVCLDFGVKYNTLRRLVNMGAEIKVIPAKSSVAEILSHNPDGVYLSNGPGDPEAVTYGIATVKALAELDVPVFGICLGHQILALSLGAETYKLKFGHRGANHPILNIKTGEVEITSQNHGFAVKPDTLPANTAEVTHINLNDQTIAGIAHKSKPIFSIQYHPEASPGPHDSYYLFRKFADNARKYKTQKV
jgi:carbamoyl-phosphate synthase small subunit